MTAAQLQPFVLIPTGQSFMTPHRHFTWHRTADGVVVYKIDGHEVTEAEWMIKPTDLSK